MRGHPLLPELQLVAAKVGKNAPGGAPGPRLPADFLFMKIGGNVNTSTSVYKIGAATLGSDGHYSIRIHRTYRPVTFFLEGSV